jgi:hypothetical protein
MERRSRARAIAALLLAATMSMAVHAGAQGAASESPIPAGEIPDVLRARSGKPVILQLRSGKEYGGTVGEVRGQSVVVKSIAGKEFYDVLVRMDDISAIEIRNR